MSTRRPTAPRPGRTGASSPPGGQPGQDSGARPRTTATSGQTRSATGETQTTGGPPKGAGSRSSAAGGRSGATARPGTTARPATNGRATAPRTSGRRPAGQPARAPAPRAGTRGPAGGGPARSRRVVSFGGDDGAPSPTITLRALGIFLVSLVAFAVLAPTLRFSVAQQEQLRQLNSRVSEAAERNADLETQLALWQDPQYVQAQARDRLGFVMPGETPYVVVDPETVTGGLSEAEIEAEERKEARIAATPWYLHVWDSVQVAGESATGEEDPSGLTVPEPDAG